MTYKELEPKTFAYQKALNEIDQRRNHWQKSTKPMIRELLTLIAKTYPLKWECQSLEDRKNNETVNLSLYQQASGISSDDGGKHRHYVKHGGALTFTLLYSGQVMVNIMYPFIEDLAAESPSKNLVKGISPFDVNEPFIIEQVDKFLSEMTNWESAAELIPIGFRRI